jgi:heat shock transcription factor 2
LFQQLNFYAFRKIKYADTIRIDPKLEAATANYCRFRHKPFLRGNPELLGEIKRMNGQKHKDKKITMLNLRKEEQIC